MNTFKVKLPATLAAVLVLSSCALSLQVLAKAEAKLGAKVHANTVAASSSHPTHQVNKSGGGAIAVVNPPNPGPYKTVTVNGQEMRQGRFAPGIFGGTLVQSIVGFDPKTFNPWVASDTASSRLAGLMFRGLTDIDAFTGNATPDLAVDVKMDKDGVTYTTRLRKGLKWSDGQPITADDVAFTWNTLIAGGYGNPSIRDEVAIAGKMPKVTVVDNLTNKFVTDKPFAPFINALTTPIAPKHVIEPIIKGKNGREAFLRLWGESGDTKNLVTDGPFTLSRYVPSQRIEFVASKNFYMVNSAGKRLPYLSHIIYQIIPDQNTNLLRFKAKELDLTDVRARDVVPLMASQQADNFKLWNLGHDFRMFFLVFNMNRRVDPTTHKPYVDPVKSAWFNDINFRQAVNHAIDRDMIVANYFRGIGFGLYGCEPTASPFYNTNLKSFDVDLAYCTGLLTKSGFHKNADGELLDKAGHKVEFDLYGSSGQSYNEAVGNMIADDLKKLGIKVNFQLMDFNVLGDKLERSLDYQAAMMGFGSGDRVDALDPNEAANVFRTIGRLHYFDERLADKSGVVKVTDARPWEKRLDQIFDTAAITMDKSKREALYGEFQKIVYDQAPFIYLATPMNIVAVRNSIGNYDPTELAQPVFGLHNIEEIYKK
jgi:peptide/nickel transport system substrate-binding protein